VRSESSFFSVGKDKLLKSGYILDIDLDFWAPEMGINFQKCLPKLRLLTEKASAVTIATSPYFLDQKRALEIIEEIF
jgi:hypothetical protein